MDVFYYLCYVLAFSSDHGYRIKVFGDNEEYIVQVKDKVRVSKIIDFEDVPEVKSVFRLVNTGPDKYKLKVCENYITAKEPDPGIIISENDDTNYTEWVLDKDGDKGYILKNELKDQCLTVTDHFDPSTNGFYMNRRGCSGSLPNVFNFIDAGLLNHFCKADAKSFCKNLERKEKYKKQRKNEEKRKGGSGNFGIESSSSDDSNYDDDSSDERNDRPKKRNRDRRPVDDYDDRPKKRNRDKRPVDDYDDRPKKRDRDRSPRYDDGPKKRNRDRRPVDDYDDDLSSDEIDRPRRGEPKKNRWDDDVSSYDQDDRPKRITGSEPSSDEIPEQESRRKPSKRRPKSKKHHDRHHGDMSEHEYHHGNDDDD